MLAITCLIAAGSLVSVAGQHNPFFRSPIIDGGEVTHYQEISPSGSSYTWGYKYPGQYHLESKLPSGEVLGSVGYVDPEGSSVAWNYGAGNTNGFRVFGEDTEGHQDLWDSLPGASETVFNRDVLLKSYNQHRPIKDTGITNRIVPVAVLLKRAELPEAPVGQNVDLQAPAVLPEGPDDSVALSVPLGSVLFRALNPSAPILKSGLDGGYPGHFVISPDVIQEAGGVSAAAVKFGAAPIAAVHDAKVPKYH